MGSDRVILLTGATGLVGGELARRYSQRGLRTYALVRAPSAEAAARRLAARLGPAVGSVPRPILGDLTAPGLGLAPNVRDRLIDEVTDIVHAATDINFGRPLDEARAVNVEGTARLLELAASAGRLRQFGHVSTAHVAGRRSGRILETEAEHSAGWVNTYEQTKYEAEQLLRQRMPDLPIAIYRMSSVVGDSRTGEVRQFNFIHQLIRLLWSGLLPALPGDPSGPVDLIASDWVADALVALFDARFTPGGVFHLCAGPENAYTLGEVMDVTLMHLNRLRPPDRRPLAAPELVSLAEFERRVEAAERSGKHRLALALRGIATFAPQLALPKAFDNCLAQQALAGTGVTLPDIHTYYPLVVEYCVRSNWGRSVPAPGAPVEVTNGS